MNEESYQDHNVQAEAIEGLLCSIGRDEVVHVLKKIITGMF